MGRVRVWIEEEEGREGGEDRRKGKMEREERYRCTNVNVPL